eukprot:jgi/Orpsp1_1/1179057/evm.model.c7180000067760.1
MFNKICFKALNFALLASLVLSKTFDSCEKLSSSIKKIEGKNIIFGCGINENNIIEYLEIYSNEVGNRKLKSETIKKIFSYDTLTSLEYYHDFSAIEEDEFPISKLTNLERLVIGNSNRSYQDIKYDDSKLKRYPINKNIIKSIPKSVKILELSEIAMTQNNLDELSTLKQLKELNLVRLNLNELKLNFDGDKKFEKITSLSISEDKKLSKSVFNIITKFTNLKELELSFPDPLDKSSIKEDYLKLLNKLKSLKTLKFLTPYEETELIDTICSVTNIEK